MTRTGSGLKYNFTIALEEHAINGPLFPEEKKLANKNKYSANLE
jgi:hypothetical protein